MKIWDKIYHNIKELLEHKKRSAQNLWKLTETVNNPSLKMVLLNLWRIEIHHALSLNKLLQSLGYEQIKLIDKDNYNCIDTSTTLKKNIEEREKWLPVLEKITNETFGNDIYYTFMGIYIDDLVNMEVLQELEGQDFALLN